MLYLIDTGVLLRLFNRTEPSHATIRQCLWNLRKAGHRFIVSPQNIAEFWNVSTRPVAARGGYGLSIEETERCVRVIERICEVLADEPSTYSVWRQLVLDHGVKGVQVHDARLVAWMKTQVINHVITLNGADFSRYPGIVAASPDTLLAATK